MARRTTSRTPVAFARANPHERDVFRELFAIKETGYPFDEPGIQRKVDGYTKLVWMGPQYDKDVPSYQLTVFDMGGRTVFTLARGQSFRSVSKTHGDVFGVVPHRGARGFGPSALFELRPTVCTGHLRVGPFAAHNAPVDRDAAEMAVVLLERLIDLARLHPKLLRKLGMATYTGLLAWQEKRVAAWAAARARRAHGAR